MGMGLMHRETHQEGLITSMEALRNLLKAKRGNSVLDICCRSGDLAFHLSEKVGLDEEKVYMPLDLFIHLRDLLADDWFRFFQRSIVNYFIAAAKRSSSCYKNIENVIDKERAMHENFRVLKPSCKASILDYNKSKQPVTVKKPICLFLWDWMIENVVVPAATGYCLAEEYKNLKSSIQQFRF
ncbi:2-phytyl-1 4-beta-naphthoquinone methyltransferase chloroplastic [Bienertia sinuspersici]